MIDFNKLMTEELEECRKANIFRARQIPELPLKAEPVLGTPLRGSSAANPHHITMDEETDLNGEFGPQQVQSLLALVVDLPLHKKMEGAVDDAAAVYHLNRLKNR